MLNLVIPIKDFDLDLQFQSLFQWRSQKKFEGEVVRNQWFAGGRHISGERDVHFL
jgi:hypothetical protein